MSTSPLPQPPISNDQLRADYPEFGDTNAFPESSLTYWINLATSYINPARWLDQTGIGIELFAAHNLTLEARAMADTVRGGAPGQSKGVISSVSADGVSVSYDTASALDPKAEHWNLTIYGTRFWNLMKIAGAGPIQVGTAGFLSGTVPGLSFGGPWPGPLPWPWS